MEGVKGFFAGILIFSLSTISFGFLPGGLVNILQLGGLAIFAYYWIKLASLQNISNRYLQVMIIVLLLWELFIVCHGFIFQIPYIKEHLFADNRALAYLVPLTTFLAVNQSYLWQKLIDYSYKLGICFLLFLPICTLLPISWEQYVWALAIGCGFIMLTAYYQPRKKVTIASIVIFAALVLITIAARRNIMLTCGLYFLFSFLILPVFNKNITLFKKGWLIFAFLLLVTIGYFMFISDYFSVFNKIKERADEDTRTVVVFLYLEDMNSQDWVIGKGINGTYYCPGVDEDWLSGIDGHGHRDLDYRTFIECGYLQLILNGGGIYLLFYLMIVVPAMIKGFSSKNLFGKACAVLILMHLIDMLPFGLPTFSWRQFILWFCIAACYSKEMMTKSDKDMRNFLTPNQNKV